MTRPPKPDAAPLDDAALNALFKAGSRPQPSAALTARILRDAATHQPQAAQPVVPERGLFATLAAVFGGWPTLGGLATATLAGLYIGFAQPDLLGQTLDQPLDQTDADFVLDLTEEDALLGLFPGDALFFEEG